MAGKPTVEQLNTLIRLKQGDRYYPQSRTATALDRDGYTTDHAGRLTGKGDTTATRLLDLNDRREYDRLSTVELQALDAADQLGEDAYTAVALDPDRRPAIRRWAVDRMDSTTFDKIMDRLAADPNPDIRRIIIGHHRILQPGRLLSLFRDENDPTVLLDLLWNLTPVSEETIRFTERRLDHPNPQVRTAALKTLPEPERGQAAIRLLDDPDIDVFREAIGYAHVPLTDGQTERALHDPNAMFQLAYHGVGMTDDTITHLLADPRTSGVMGLRLTDYTEAYQRYVQARRLFADPDGSTVAKEHRGMEE